MKICLVSEYYYPVLGGITEHIHQYARQCILKGHDVTLLTSDNGEIPSNLKLPGLKIKKIGKSFPVHSNESFARITLSPFLGTRICRFLEKGNFDIVHIHAALTPTLPLLAVKYSPTVTVGTFHTYFDKILVLEVLHKKIQKVVDWHDSIIAVSQSCIDAMGRYFKFDPVIIPNGVDTDWFASGTPRREITRDRFNIFFLGRLDPRNGLDTLIEGFALLRKRNVKSRLIVAGDGPLKEFYKSMVPAEIRDDVWFVGAINHERPDYFASVDAFCYPATKASFGITLLESMSAGVPVVASRIRGFKEIISDHVDGVLVPEQNPTALANAFEMLSVDRSLRIRLQEHGLVRAQEFSWGKVSQRILDHYLKVQQAPVSIARAG